MELLLICRAAGGGGGSMHERELICVHVQIHIQG